MSCSELSRLTLQQLAEGDNLNADAIRRHLSTCPQCAHSLEPTRQEWGRLEQAGQAFARKSPVFEQPAETHSMARFWWAVAAMVLLTGGLLAARFWQGMPAVTSEVDHVAWPTLPDATPHLMLLDIAENRQDRTMIIVNMDTLERVAFTVPQNGGEAPRVTGLGEWRVSAVRDTGVEVSLGDRREVLTFDHGAWDGYFDATCEYFESRLKTSSMRAGDWDTLRSLLALRDTRLAGLVMATANDATHRYHAEASELLNAAGPAFVATCRLWHTFQTGSRDSRLQSLRTLIGMESPEARMLLREALTRVQDPLLPVIVEELLKRPDDITRAQLRELALRPETPESVRALIDRFDAREGK